MPIRCVKLQQLFTINLRLNIVGREQIFFFLLKKPFYSGFIVIKINDKNGKDIKQGVIFFFKPIARNIGQ